MITVNTTFDKAVPLPDGYTKPLEVSLVGTPTTSNYTVSLNQSGIADADAGTGANNLITSVESDFNTRYAPDVLGLDSAADVDVVLKITSCTPSFNNTHMFETSTPIYIVKIFVQWVVTP